MCGIVGYIGSKQAAPILIKGLEKLEYRGYDSAGVAIYNEGSINVVKTKGRLQVLADMIDEGKAMKGTMGIGHTRWATHGAPSDINSHPHVSNSGRFVVVHNGIIENYAPLKEYLIKNGYNFVSETDTEVVAHLVEYHYNGDLIETVIKVMTLLEGSYAFGIISADNPDCMVAVRKDSPLIVGLGEGENFIASDIPSLLTHTRNIYYLDDKEIVLLEKDKVTIYDTNKNVVKKEVSQIQWDVEAAEKGGYEHFMFKEIMEQPKALLNTLQPRIKNGKIILDDFHLTKEMLANFNKIYIVACGSAYHVGVVGKYAIEAMTRIPVEVDIASEFRYRNPLIDTKTLMIIISQSGETADTLAALRHGRNNGAHILSIVNVLGSSIANASDDVLYTWAGPEIAVATTKAYSTQLSVIYLLAVYMAELLGKISTEEVKAYTEELLALPVKLEQLLENKEDIQYWASQFYNRKNIFFIGRNMDYAVALEGSLKLKEISYIHSEAYAGGELKHGTISLIEPGTLVVALATYAPLVEKMISNIREVKARGAVVMSIASEKNTALEEASDTVVYTPQTMELLQPSLTVIPLQFFAYYVASMKGCSIDKPRNLAKSVTVE
ncbi:MAG: glutamine--fructose-6-phosphate transaminase (isomerizing) [Clostridia bacterium]|jgi:glucosamine--fructose-6-phosphate aminotransferase (isomerizing)|nr:glutamine--fructose-6-phosphate transaminase (isomerizing) [Clostridia bacterium]